MLANRSFGGAQVSRTFYAKGQTGQQLLLGAYSSLMRQVHAGTVELYTRYEMLDLVIIDGRARGIIARNLVTGQLERFAAHAVVIGTGGYGNTYFLSTNAMGCNASAAIACYRKGAVFANPSYVQIHPNVYPRTRRQTVENSPSCPSRSATRPHLGAQKARRRQGLSRRSSPR